MRLRSAAASFSGDGDGEEVVVVWVRERRGWWAWRVWGWDCGGARVW